jgi:hypothetical protein
MIANPLDNNGTNTISAVLSGAPVGSYVFKFNGSFYGPIEYYGGGTWDDGAVTMNPGEGIFIQSPSNAVITFVGNVKTGLSTNSIPSNFSIRSSIVPQAGGLETALGFPAKAGDYIFSFNPGTQGYNGPFEAFGDGSGWDPSEPNISVGQAFWVNRTGGASTNWVRNFNP